MPPEKKQVLNVEARKRLEVEEDLYFDQQAKLIAKELARPALVWVDLPPNVHPEPERPLMVKGCMQWSPLSPQIRGCH